MQSSPYRHYSPQLYTSSEVQAQNHDINLSTSLHNSQHSSVDYTYSSSKVRSQLSREEMQVYNTPFAGNVGYKESGTFPRKVKAMKMPPNQSFGLPAYTGLDRTKPVKISNNSLDYCGTPDRASPMPTFQIQIIKPGRNVNVKRNSMPPYGKGYMPNIGEKRRIDIEKSEKPLGISIRCRNNRGIFVSHVNNGSIASQVGLQVGDQLLEFCGINMRSATYDLAAKFLRQCGNSITMLVQYNPEKYEELSTSDENVSRSDDSTPQNSPKATRSVISTDSAHSSKRISTVLQDSPHSTGTVKSHRNQMTLPMQQDKSSSISSSSGNTLGKEQPRVVYIETR
jgi:discs large protein 5